MGSEFRLVTFVSLRVSSIDLQNSLILFSISMASNLLPLIPTTHSSAYRTYTNLLKLSDPKSIEGRRDLSMSLRIFFRSPSFLAFNMWYSKYLLSLDLVALTPLSKSSLRDNTNWSNW